MDAAFAFTSLLPPPRRRRGGGATTAYQFKRLGPRRSVGVARSTATALTPEEEEEEEEDKMPNHAATWFREGEGGAQITRQRPTHTHTAEQIKA